MTCFNCKTEFGDLAGYKVTRLDSVFDFCGRRCLSEWIAPELKQVCVTKQWIPTPEEEERMAQ